MPAECCEFNPDHAASFHKELIKLYTISQSSPLLHSEPGCWSFRPLTLQEVSIDIPAIKGQVLLPSRQSLRENLNPHTGERVFLPKRWDNQVHKVLMRVLCHEELQCRSTARTYGHQILQFDSFAERQCDVLWDASPDEVCQAYLKYLKGRGAVVQHKHKKFHVSVDPCDPKVVKSSTLLVIHEAIRTFYRLAKKLKLYRHKGHPLDNINVSELQRIRDGGEIYGSRQRRYHPGFYALFTDDTWALQPLLDEHMFSDRLRQAFERKGVRQRDRAILELMLTGGPRLSEAAGATLEGWAFFDERGRAFHGRLFLHNKGDGDWPSKRVIVTPRTADLIRHYFMHERPKHDPLAKDYRAWAARNNAQPDFSPESYMLFIRETRSVQRSNSVHESPVRTPIFLTCTGKPYSDSAFRQVAWRPALAEADPPIDARPHQMRHWFVTMALIGITVNFGNDQLKMMAARKQLGTYMHWKWPDQMLMVYDQSLQSHFGENPASSMAQYAEERLREHDGNIKNMLSTLGFRGAETKDRLADDAALFAEIQAAGRDK